MIMTMTMITMGEVEIEYCMTWVVYLRAGK